MAMKSRVARPPLTPLNAILLAFPIALFTVAVVSDIAYLRSAEIQWTNISAWMITGALVFGGLVLAWSLIDLFVGWRRPGRSRAVIYFLLLAGMWIFGLINAFHHSQDAWSSVGTPGMVLSILSAVMALAAGWLGYSRPDVQEIEQ